MQIDVPFIPNEGNDCGPAALQMALKHFGLDASLAELRSLTRAEKDGMAYTLGLGVAAVRLGCTVQYHTSSLGANPDNFKTEFYREHAGGFDEASAKMSALLLEFLTHKGKVEVGSLQLKEILERLDERTVPIVLVDYHKLVGRKGYQGHFLPIVGYAQDEVIVHQPGPEGAQAFLRIGKDVFEEARTAQGTDEDVLFISGK